MHRAIVALVAVIFVLLAVIVWQFAHRVWSSVLVATADTHTEIFAEMVTKASESLGKSPPDVRAAVGYLDYAHCYYPSGTRQRKGSSLDRIVERTRGLAEMRIIDMLRQVTGRDLGTNVEDWIHEYGEKSDVQE